MQTVTESLADRLKALDACKEATEWAAKYESAQAAWDACERGDWLVWAVGRTINCEPWTDGRKPLLLCALECAETIKHLWPESSKDRIVAAVAVLRKWAGGDATIDEAKQARKELSVAYAYAADAADAAYAAYAAAYAADAADAAYAAYAAAYAAYAADAYAAYAADRPKILKQCADIARKHFPVPPSGRAPI